MLDIILLIFLTRYIGTIAIRKGLKPSTWKSYTILAWFGAEIAGLSIGFLLIGADDLLQLGLFGLVFGFGGFLAIKYTLDKKPDSIEEDINRIGTDDLRP